MTVKNKLLIFDINYTKGVNREPFIAKIRFWKKLKLTFFTNLEGKKYYSEKLKNIDFIVVPFKHKIKFQRDVVWSTILLHFKAWPVWFRNLSKFEKVYCMSGTIDFLILPWIGKLFNKNLKIYVVIDNLVSNPFKNPGNLILKTLSFLGFRLGNILLRKTSAIFLVSDTLKEYYKRKGIKVIKTGDRYGIDTSIFKSIIRKSPSCDLLFAGRLHPAKGIFDLVDVVGLLKRRINNISLGIMGDGDIEIKRKLFRQIKKNNLKNNIKILGYKEGVEKGSIYSKCKLFLFLSYDEHCPQVVIEALAANKQVVAYELPIYYDVFGEFIKTGQLKTFKKKGKEKIVCFIIRFLKKPLKYNNTLKNFDWDKIARKEIKEMFPKLGKNIN